MHKPREPYKISIISTHGTGKTTLCYAVAAQLKSRGLKVKVFSEIAAAAFEDGIPINENTTLPAQMYILLQHMCEEIKGVIRNYDVIVADRSVYDNWVYMQRRCGTQNNMFVIDFLRQYAAQFPYNAIYKLPLTGKMTDDGVRDAFDESFQRDVYRRLNALLEALSIPHKTLPEPTSEFRKEWRDMIVTDTLRNLERQAPRRKTPCGNDGPPSNAAPAKRGQVITTITS